MKKLLLCLLFLSLNLFANSTLNTDDLYKEYQNSNNIWLLSLRNYQNYIDIDTKLKTLQNKLDEERTENSADKTARTAEEIGILENNLNLYDYKNKEPLYELLDPFNTILQQFERAKISFFSLASNELEKSVKEADSLIKNYQNEYQKALLQIETLENENISNGLKTKLENDKQLLKVSLDTLTKTHANVLKQYDAYRQEAKHFKSEELRRLFYVLLFIAVIFVLLNAAKFFLLKKKTLKNEDDSQRSFVIRKIMNILFVIIIILTFALTYIENIAQILAVFGVIGAGLTVVMKEWVLSYVGWFVLITSNSIQMGDRIKITKDGHSIIGDVINISLTKLTLYENITNDALTEHKKAGRVIFVPNYYLIMGEVFNYTHLSLKTILDLIEIRISFDSNIEKAEKIALESAELLTNRFTEMAKKQYDALKNRYTLRNMPQFPKVFFYPSGSGNGVVMGVWYVSPYREILKHKSEITKELIRRLSQEKDIKLLYSGQSVFLEKEFSDHVI